MRFKRYCLAYTEYGPRPFPVEAFTAFMDDATLSSWAARIDSQQDEEIFRQFLPQYAWLIKSARRRGFGPQ